jgi:quercetin dioxygenase-like cupin family protein
VTDRRRALAGGDFSVEDVFRRPVVPVQSLAEEEATVKIQQVPFTVVDWSTVSASEHPGECGTAYWRTFEAGNIRVRVVEYSPGYLADHWCSRGHVLYVLEGELETQLRGESSVVLKPGMSYQVEDDAPAPHRSFTRTGAKLFIVD